jgi:hypothetical protein
MPPFWTLIATTHGKDRALLKNLAASTVEEILAFDHEVYRQLHRAYTGDLWCAAYIACGGCSDDGFDYFCGWLISQGETVFEAALQNPDSLVEPLKRCRSYPENGDLLSVAARAYTKKTGNEDFYELPRPERVPRPALVFRWREEDPESMRVICPRIFERFWEEPL